MKRVARGLMKGIVENSAVRGNRALCRATPTDDDLTHGPPTEFYLLHSAVASLTAPVTAVKEVR